MAKQPREKTAETLGANVKYLREHASISQAELARRMTDRGWPWHQSTVYRVESGRQPVRFDEAVDLADLLGTTLDRLTWAIGEAAEQELAEQALARLLAGADSAVEAIAQLHATRAAADRAARDAVRSEYPRVRKLAAPIAEGLMGTMIERVVFSGEAQWREMAEELDPAGDARPEEARAERGLWRGDLGRADYFWEGLITRAHGTDGSNPIGELISTLRQTEEGRAGLAELDKKTHRMYAADYSQAGGLAGRREEQERLVSIGREMFGERGPATQEQLDQVVARGREQGVKRHPFVMHRLSDEGLEIVDPAEADSPDSADDGDGARDA